MFKALVFQFLKVLLFWILIFSFQRVLFSIHNWDKFASVSTWEWLASFFHAFKLDLATAGGLSIFSMIFLVLFHVFHARAFTGSTHAPYDQPKAKGKVFDGIEADFMNSVVYADYALSTFIEEAKKQAWFDNTLFIFVADHRHSTPTTQNPGSHMFYRIPLLFWGNPLKADYQGKRIDKIGSQADLAATLLYQLKLDASDYPYSKDLLNPKAPEFAFHAITRGYGWVSPTGNFTYQMQLKMYLEDSYKKTKSQK